MDYNPDDYYSSSGDDVPSAPAIGVEKKNKETKAPAKRIMTEAKLAQLKRAREAKARKRTERQSSTTQPKTNTKQPPTPAPQPADQQAVSHSDGDSEVGVVSIRAPKRTKPKRKKRIVIQQP